MTWSGVGQAGEVAPTPPRPAEARIVAVGSARLPKAVVGEGPGALMVELVIEAGESSIVDVATNLGLPGCNALLRTLLVGRTLDDVGKVVEELSERLRGPIAKPAAAALLRAAASARNGGAADEDARVS